MKKLSAAIILCSLFVSTAFMIGCRRTESVLHHIDTGTYMADSFLSDGDSPIYLTILSDDTWVLFDSATTIIEQGVCKSDNLVWTLYDENNVPFASLVPIGRNTVCLVVSPINNLILTRVETDGTIVPWQ